jgi:hypothetical protein
MISKAKRTLWTWQIILAACSFFDVYMFFLKGFIVPDRAFVLALTTVYSILFFKKSRYAWTVLFYGCAAIIPVTVLSIFLGYTPAPTPVTPLAEGLVLVIAIFSVSQIWGIRQSSKELLTSTWPLKSQDRA